MTAVQILMSTIVSVQNVNVESDLQKTEIAQNIHQMKRIY